MHLIVLMKKTKSFQIYLFIYFSFYLLLLSVYILNLRQLKVWVLLEMYSIDVLMGKKKQKTKASQILPLSFCLL
jgi:hypothetical protein